MVLSDVGIAVDARHSTEGFRTSDFDPLRILKVCDFDEGVVGIPAQAARYSSPAFRRPLRYALRPSGCFVSKVVSR